MTSSTDKLAREIQRLKSQLVALSTTPRLANSSIENGAVDAYDAEGNLVMEIGQQFDGTHTAASLSGPTPAAPTAPVLTASQLSLTAAWDGIFVDAFGLPDALSFAPQDWSRLEVHVSTVKGFDPLTSDTLRGTIETPRGADVVVGPLPAVPHFVRFVTRTLSGKASASSAEVEITPLPAVDRVAFDAKMGQLDKAIADTNLLLDESNGELASATQRLGAAEDDLDSAFGRIATAENTLGTVPNQISAANAATLTSAATTAQTKADAARTSAITAAATDATTKADLAIEKSIAAGGYQLNPSFDDWSGAYPAGFSAWNGAQAVKDTATARRGKLACRFNTAASTTQVGMFFGNTLAHMPNQEYVTVEVEFTLISGTSLSGAGVAVDWTGLTPITIRGLVSLAAEIPTPVVGRTYRVVKTLKRPTSTGGTWTGMSGYLFGNWTNLGGAVKDISYDWLNVRPATAEEITAFNAPADASAKAAAAQDAAALDATAKADAAREAALLVARQAAGLAGIKGTVWTQPDTPKSGVSYRYTGGKHTSPSQQLLDGVVQRTNEFYNPIMEGTSGTLDVYRNLVTDPRCTTANRSSNTSRWFGGSGHPGGTLGAGTYTFGAPLTDHPLGIATAVQKTWTGDGTVGDTGFNGVSVPVTAGVWYHASAYLKHDSVRDKAFAIRFVFKDASNVTVGPNSFTTTVGTTGEWKRPVAYAQAPAGAVTMFPLYDVVGGDYWRVGENLWGTGFMVGAFDMHIPYFDGEISVDPDFTPVWVSGAHNSSSIARATIPTGIVSQRAAAIQVVRGGKKAVRIIPVTSGFNGHGPYAGSDVFADMATGMGRTVEAGKTYTISASIEFERMPLTPGGARFRNSFPGGERNAGVTPTAVGRYTMEHTWVAPSSGTGGFMRIMPNAPGMAASRNDFLIHDITFTEGTQVTPVLHGDLVDDRAGDLWIDTDEKNQPKRWDAGTDTWISVTDQSAIDAATAVAALDATAKADAAKAAAISAAAADATAKADSAQTAATTAAAADAASKAATAEANAKTAAAADAKTKADAAQAAAISAAATEAQLKANGAQAAAIAAAATDAQTKANAAEAAAKTAAAADAASKAATAEANAKAAAATDATTKANAAQAAAIAAAKTETTSQVTTVNNSILGQTYYGTAVPTASSPAGARVGSTYRRRDANNVIIAEYEWTGATNGWVQRKISGASLTALEVGTLTAGDLAVETAVAQKLAAAQASFTKADIGNLTVTGTTNLADAVAQRIAANTGSFISLAVSQLVAGTATMSQAVIDKLHADVVLSRQVIADTVKAGAIDGQVITGPTIQTSAEANRGVKWTNAGITAYNPTTGTPTLRVDSATGNVSTVGSLTATGQYFDEVTDTFMPASLTIEDRPRINPSTDTSYNVAGLFFDTDPTSEISLTGSKHGIAMGSNVTATDVFAAVSAGNGEAVLVASEGTYPNYDWQSDVKVSKTRAGFDHYEPVNSRQSILGVNTTLSRAQLSTARTDNAQYAGLEARFDGSTMLQTSNSTGSLATSIEQKDGVIDLTGQTINLSGNVTVGATKLDVGFGAFQVDRTGVPSNSVWGPGMPSWVNANMFNFNFGAWASNDRFVFSKIGLYTVTYTIAVSGVTGRTFCSLEQTGATISLARNSIAPNSGEDTVTCSFTGRFNVGDDCNFRFFKNSAQTLVKSRGTIVRHVGL